MATYEVRLKESFFWYGDADSALASAYKLWQPFREAYDEKLRVAGSPPQKESEREAYVRAMSAAEDDFQRASLTYAPNALMLLGYAMENAAKGLKVQLDSATIWPATAPGATPAPVDELPEALKNHTVGPTYLTQTLALALEETTLLESLSDFTIWKGRYSAPTKEIHDGDIAWATDWFEKGVAVLVKIETRAGREVFAKARSAGVPGLPPSQA